MAHRSMVVSNDKSCPYQIIIVEDERAMADMLMRTIRRQVPRIAVQTFVTGQAALTAYDQVGADLLVVNYGLPDMVGSALIRRLRARGDPVPVIGISGDPGNEAEHLAAGADVFLSGRDVLHQMVLLLRHFLP